jgi:hypothetical protein
METGQQPARSWMTDGIIIAVATATGYLWALFYEIGFSGYFYIPYHFISISPVSVLSTPVPFIIFFAAVIFLFPAARQAGNQLDIFMRRSTTHHVSVIILVFLFFLSIPFLGITFRRLETFISIPFLIMIIVGIMIFFAKPLFMRQREGSYWDKLAPPLKPIGEIGPSSYLSNPRPMGFVAIFLFFCAVLALSFAFRGLGKTIARGTKQFQVIAQSPDIPEVAVLQVYGDYLFTAPFNPSTKEFEKTLYILKISEISKTPLTLKNIGPLRGKP